MAYSAPSSVWLYSSRPRLRRITSSLLPDDGGPYNKRTRLRTSEPKAAALKYSITLAMASSIPKR